MRRTRGRYRRSGGDTTHEAAKTAAARRLGERPRWRLMQAAGTSNALYRGGLADGGAVVLRVNAGRASAFGVDRSREARVLQRIAGGEWAPEVLTNQPDEGWLLMRDHRATPRPDHIGGVVTERLLAAVIEWQTITEVPSLDYEALLGQYEARLSCLPRWASPSFTALLQAMRAGIARLPAYRSCLVHHDLHPGNLCWNGERLVVVDWEYAGLANPWFDAVQLHSELGVDDEALHTLPALYNPSADTMAAGLDLAARLMAALGWLWEAARAPAEVDAEKRRRVEAVLETLLVEQKPPFGRPSDA